MVSLKFSMPHDYGRLFCKIQHTCEHDVNVDLIFLCFWLSLWRAIVLRFVDFPGIVCVSIICTDSAFAGSAGLRNEN